MNKNDCIEIMPAENGFIVTRSRGRYMSDSITATNEMLVFRTMAELQNWLGEHFTHRARPNWPDIMPKTKVKSAGVVTVT